MGELRAGRDAELREDVAEVVVDRPRREKQLGGDLLVGEPLCDEAGDLQLLWRQLIDRARVALARRLAGGAQLGARSLGPGLGSEALEPLERSAQLHTRVGAAALAPEMLAVEQLDTSEIERPGVDASRSASSKYSLPPRPPRATRGNWQAATAPTPP